MEETRVMTDWARTNDPILKDPDHVLARMVEFERNGIWVPAIEHRIELAQPPSRDRSYTWAAPEKHTPKGFAELKHRFARTFEMYEVAKNKQAKEEAEREAEIQARIEAEVEAKLAAKLATKKGTPAPTKKIQEST